MIFNCIIARSSGSDVGFLLHCLRRKQFPLKGIWFYSAAKRMNGINKLIDILKSLVHRGVTQIRHFIDPTQFLENFRDTCGELAPVEWLMCSVAFHDAQIRSLDFFVRGKAIFAFQTLPPPANTRTVPRLTGIDDLVVTRPALGVTP